MTTTMPDKCPRCGVVFTFWAPKRDVYRDVLGRVHTPGGMDCLRRQVAALRDALVAIRRCGVECSECRSEINIALRPYEPAEVADDGDT